METSAGNETQGLKPLKLIETFPASRRRMPDEIYDPHSSGDEHCRLPEFDRPVSMRPGSSPEDTRDEADDKEVERGAQRRKKKSPSHQPSENDEEFFPCIDEQPSRKNEHPEKKGLQKMVIKPECIEAMRSGDARESPHDHKNRNEKPSGFPFRNAKGDEDQKRICQRRKDSGQPLGLECPRTGYQRMNSKDRLGHQAHQEGWNADLIAGRKTRVGIEGNCFPGENRLLQPPDIQKNVGIEKWNSAVT
ncbi:MAG TPA: hypothetical protein PLU72_01365 [Candidatus Ozemobacteraceae bacterium]|nr:hypothetical protein [Candidatus Ozemobacteraceae bacterium]